jgi:dTDP-4-dehydrorhamnose 3,5-epimerase
MAMIQGARKDSQSTTADWTPVGEEQIAGVVRKEVRNVVKDSGHLCELYRRDWQLDGKPVEQVFIMMLEPGGVSAWHCHRTTTDRLAVASGNAHLVLYDDREDSPTRGLVNHFRMGHLRPMVVVIPPMVWHGVATLGSLPAIVVNMVDVAYDYEDPDHWRIPADDPQAPYRFASGGSGP